MYGDSPRYNDLYCDQLIELLTRYGKIAEVWFDGANGEGPNGKKQIYDWSRIWALVRKLQPDAIMFSDAGPDVRWCGNENGSGGETNWSSVNPSVVTIPGASGPDVTSSLQHGDANGTVWRPAEADTSIRPGWFYHPADDEKVRSVDNVYDLYFRSVGRNAKLLLNVPPTRDGLLHVTDVAHLTGLQTKLTALGASAIQEHAKPAWAVTGARSAELILTYDRRREVSAFRLGEHTVSGQCVARWSLYGEDSGDWTLLSHGTTVGYARMERLEQTSVRSVKLVIETTVATPRRVHMTLYG